MPQFKKVEMLPPLSSAQELQLGEYIPKIDSFIIILDSSSGGSAGSRCVRELRERRPAARYARCTLLAGVRAVQENIIPPTINYENPDPECDLDYVPNEARQITVNTAMSNSLGFGGHNASVIIKKFQE